MDRTTMATKRLRGDDALYSLMEELSSQQGYDEQDVVKRAGSKETSRAPRVRLTAEVDGYPSGSSSFTTEQSLPTGSIWNPLVRSSCNADLSSTRFPPTNPHVEVFRRRAYEKLKSEFRAVLDRVIANNPTESNKPKSLWGDLAIPSLLERWHFDVKLEEFLELQQRHPTGMATAQVTNFSTAEIRSAMLHGREGEQAFLMDPILVSGSPRSPTGQTGDQSLRKFRSPSVLLGEELKFEWTRTWRRIRGERPDMTALDAVFGSKGYRKKVSKISQAIRFQCLDAETGLASEITRRAAMEDKLSSSSKHSNKSLPKVITMEDDEEVDVKFSGLSFRIHQDHFEKLQVMFDRIHPSSIDETTHRASFASALFCLLARYDMLQGAGLQASMQGPVFDVLLKHFDCRMECFASPLNCRYERFCSAYTDTDAAFGSVGSFFDYDFAARGGCYQANPPFTTNFMRSMYKTMDQSLSRCTDKPLMFVVVVPAWEDTEGWKALRDSSHLNRHMTIPQESHYYCEGTQHRRKERYRVASFDTSIFFLQNELARRQWHITDEQLRDLRAAFAQNPEDDKAEMASTPVPSGDRSYKRAKSSKSSKLSSTEPPPQPAKMDNASTGSSDVAIKSSHRKRDKKKRKRQKPLDDGDEEDKQRSILDSLGLG